MTAPEMHVMFRQYAQQMGMQNVRAILPEQIDLVLNTSQMDILNQIIKENISSTNDRIITDNSKIGQINALRTLYKVSILNLAPQGANSNGETVSKENPAVLHFNKKNRNIGLLSNIGSLTDFFIPNYLFIVDFSINYKQVLNNKGYNGDSINDLVVEFSDNSIETNYFPVRLIDDSYLADTLNDFILKPRLRSPIIVLYSQGIQNRTIFDLYIDKFKEVKSGTETRYVLDNNLIPYSLRMSYIAPPKDIKYREDLGEDNSDCELPEYMHIDIVKHAVDLWRIAVSGSLMAQQAQEQQARQENMRNNYRNEGNPQQ